MVIWLATWSFFFYLVRGPLTECRYEHGQASLLILFDFLSEGQASFTIIQLLSEAGYHA
jgi:hypothetical protein